jgi:protein-tyrosine-phosphatase
MKVLFICQDNVGRIQMTEALFRSCTAETREANSAGLSVGNNGEQRIGDLASAAHILNVMREIGINLNGAKRKQFNGDDLNQYNKIISMVAYEHAPEVLQNDSRVPFWDVADPFEKGEKFTRNTRDIISDHTKQLIKGL